MNTDEEIADIIDDGADYIEEHGWCQGGLYDWIAADQYPPACIMGGLLVGNAVQNDVINRLSVLYTTGRMPMNVVVTAFRDHAPEIGTISAWNDQVCETQQQALDLMRTVAKRIRIGAES